MVDIILIDRSKHNRHKEVYSIYIFCNIEYNKRLSRRSENVQYITLSLFMLQSTVDY